MDVVSGLLIFFERWFRVGDTVAIDPWGVEGIVEEFSLRSVKIRSATGEVIHVANSEVKAARVIPRGYRELEIEVFVNDCERGRDLVEARFACSRSARRTSSGDRRSTRSSGSTTTSSASVPARRGVGREWLAEELFPSLVKGGRPRSCSCTVQS